MKPFNLKAALAGAPVVTREGSSVRIAGYDETAQEFHKVVGWVDGHVNGWSENGRFSPENEDSVLDLRMEDDNQAHDQGE